jgi:hypothetical protein
LSRSNMLDLFNSDTRKSLQFSAWFGGWKRLYSDCRLAQVLGVLALDAGYLELPRSGPNCGGSSSAVNNNMSCSCRSISGAAYWWTISGEERRHKVGQLAALLRRHEAFWKHQDQGDPLVRVRSNLLPPREAGGIEGGTRVQGRAFLNVRAMRSMSNLLVRS